MQKAIDGEGHLDGRRIFIYDGNQIVMDFRRANSQNMQIGHLRERYLWGPAVDQILAEEAVNGGADETVQWTLTDHLNTVRDIAKYDSQTDTTAVVNHLVYDAFGRVTAETSPAVDSLFLFTARPFDEDTKLQNNLNRWYDASVGRWLSEDPVGFDSGVNLYRYVLNAPMNCLDPRGTVTIVASCCSSKQIENLLDTFLAAERAARTAAAELRQVLKELNAKASGPRGIGLDWPEAYQFSNPRLGEVRRALDRWFATPVGEPTPGGYRRVGVIDWDALHKVVETAESIAKVFDVRVRVNCESSCSEGLIAYRSESVWSYLKGDTDVIHLCPAFFDKSSKERSGRLLHEISHIYASTADYGYLGARGSQRYAPQYWKPGVWGQEVEAFLESRDLAQNADTYEGFFESLYL